AAAAHIQHQADPVARGDPRQGERGAAHPEHVFGAERGAGGQFGTVRSDPPGALTGVIGGLVGGQVDRGAQRRIGDLTAGGAGAAWGSGIVGAAWGTGIVGAARGAGIVGAAWG